MNEQSRTEADHPIVAMIIELRNENAALRQQLIACEASRDRLKKFIGSHRPKVIDEGSSEEWLDCAIDDVLREPPSTALAEYLREKLEPVVVRINDYLTNGGLFNPELMEHDKVSILLIDIRDLLATLGKEKQ